MKAFIVYNLDTRLPVAVGEAIKAEWARLETAAKMKIRGENLIAEEVALAGSTKPESFLLDSLRPVPQGRNLNKQT